MARTVLGSASSHAFQGGVPAPTPDQVEPDNFAKPRTGMLPPTKKGSAITNGVFSLFTGFGERPHEWHWKRGRRLLMEYFSCSPTLPNDHPSGIECRSAVAHPPTPI